MKYVTHSTVPLKDIVKQPPGSVVYLELEPGAHASRVQNLVAGRARSAGVTLRTSTRLLLDTETLTAIRLVRVEVIDGHH